MEFLRLRAKFALFAASLSGAALFLPSAAQADTLRDALAAAYNTCLLYTSDAADE